MLLPFRLMIGILGPRNPIIGEVFSGEIDLAGSAIERFRVGDQVYGLTGFSLGAYADYKCMTEADSKRGCIALKPRNLDHASATGAAYGGLLALQFLEKGNISPGRNVLIYGASGTCGTFAVQYSKHLGANVTAVCGPSGTALVRSLGAAKVLDYSDPNSIRSLEKYDFVLDAVGKRKTSALKNAVRASISPGGMYVSIDDEDLQLSSDRLNKVTALVETGAVKPVTDRVYDLEQIVEAHRYVEQGHKKGNVAITVNRTACPIA
jgi:NADPH:quinone reductase-like Zn-dependent oxidoreductase